LKRPPDSKKSPARKKQRPRGRGDRGNNLVYTGPGKQRGQCSSLEKLPFPSGRGGTKVYKRPSRKKATSELTCLRGTKRKEKPSGEEKSRGGFFFLFVRQLTSKGPPKTIL